ncbi:hypothetical protein FAVG1_04143 [Fusarium avenaceum]|nr:hypothetical protein FAVG1_04143 [Fusarium avenaceum]
MAATKDLRAAMEATTRQFFAAYVESGERNEPAIINRDVDPDCKRFYRPISLCHWFGVPPDWSHDNEAYKAGITANLEHGSIKTCEVFNLTIDVDARRSAAMTVSNMVFKDGEELIMEHAWSLDFNGDGSKVVKVVEFSYHTRGIDLENKMANRECYYFYAPTWDNPPNGPIKLGNVISSVKEPHRPRFYHPPSADSDITKLETKSVQYTKEKFKSGRFSILTKFLSVFGFGIDVGAEIERSDQETFFFKTLETSQFIPTAAYLQKCVEAETVRRYLEITRYRKPIYIITGLKIVTGAEANTLKSRTVGSNLAVEVDGTVWSGGAVPVGGGPGIEGKTTTSQGTKWEATGDFVFAFRVSKVVVKKTGDLDEEEFRKGAMMDSESKVNKPDLSIVSVEEPDAKSEGFGDEEVMENDEVVFCGVPMPETHDN